MQQEVEFLSSVLHLLEMFVFVNMSAIYDHFEYLYSRAAMSLVRGRPSQGKQRGKPRSKSALAILRNLKKVRKCKQWPE